MTQKWRRPLPLPFPDCPPTVGIEPPILWVQQPSPTSDVALWPPSAPGPQARHALAPWDLGTHTHPHTSTGILTPQLPAPGQGWACGVSQGTSAVSRPTLCTLGSLRPRWNVGPCTEDHCPALSPVGSAGHPHQSSTSGISPICSTPRQPPHLLPLLECAGFPGPGAFALAVPAPALSLSGALPEMVLSAPCSRVSPQEGGPCPCRLWHTAGAPSVGCTGTRGAMGPPPDPPVQSSGNHLGSRGHTHTRLRLWPKLAGQPSGPQLSLGATLPAMGSRAGTGSRSVAHTRAGLSQWPSRSL